MYVYKYVITITIRIYNYNTYLSIYVFKRIYNYIVDCFEVSIQCRWMHFERFFTNVTLRFIIITFTKIFLHATFSFWHFYNVIYWSLVKNCFFISKAYYICLLIHYWSLFKFELFEIFELDAHFFKLRTIWIFNIFESFQHVLIYLYL